MNRKLGNLLKATLFALPFALPAIASAQSAGGSSSGSIGATDDTSARQTRTTTTTTTTHEQSIPSDNGGSFSNGAGQTSKSSGTGTLGIDRDGNSVGTTDATPSSDTTGDIDQHITKHKTIKRHSKTSSDGTTMNSDSSTSTTTTTNNTDKDSDAR